MSKKTIVFVDANNWYHNVKHWLTPGDLDIIKVVELLASKKDLDVVEIIWYD